MYVRTGLYYKHRANGAIFYITGSEGKGEQRYFSYYIVRSGGLWDKGEKSELGWGSVTHSNLRFIPKREILAELL